MIPKAQTYALGGGIFLLLVMAAVLLFWPESGPPADIPADREPSAPAAAVDPTREALATILDSGARLSTRIRLIAELERPLSADGVSLLRGLIGRRTENATVRNDVLALLERQPAPPDGLGAELIAMYLDEKEDPVFRDYCLQHLERVHRFDAHPKKIEKVLVEASQAGGRMAGTAMLSLERLGKRHPHLAVRVEDIARDTVLAEERDDEAAVTALQVARAAGDLTVLDKARELAAREGTLVRLRLSALGTLGDIGTREDIALLERLCEGPEKRLRRAAKHNVEKLKKRFSR